MDGFKDVTIMAAVLILAESFVSTCCISNSFLYELVLYNIMEKTVMVNNDTNLKKQTTTSTLKSLNIRKDQEICLWNSRSCIVTGTNIWQSLTNEWDLSPSVDN